MMYKELKLPTCYEEMTQEFLLLLFDYDPETGILKFKLPRPGAKPGTIAGRIVKGYATIVVNYREYAAHRLIWLMMTGQHVPEEIDHINKIRDDNRWCNLRLAARSQNCANITVHKRNFSGFKGVTYSKRDRIYFARIKVKGKVINLGYFNNPEDAARAYQVAALKYFGEFACFEQYSKIYPLGT